MSSSVLPKEVVAVFQHFLSCELATIGKDGTPIAWPMAALYMPETGRFLITTSIGIPQKAFNIRRNPHVSLLFSDSTGSGLIQPPAVLVQGNATVSDDIITWNDDLERLWRSVIQRQPAGNGLSISQHDWYYMRLLIYITPQRIRWWPQGSFEQESQVIEVNYVG